MVAPDGRKSVGCGIACELGCCLTGTEVSNTHRYIFEEHCDHRVFGFADYPMAFYMQK